MTSTIARIKRTGKTFEILVNMDSALKFKRGQEGVGDFLETETIFSDSKKGLAASNKDLEEAFGTTDTNEIAKKIVKEGEVQTTQEHRDEGKEKKRKQIIDFLSNNSIDPQTKNPHTSERIKSALEESRVNIKDVPVENQIKEIIEELTKVLPIKLESKKVRITIPAMYVGKVYGIVNTYKEEEKWKDNGDLEITVVVPSGLLIDFYDKLNSVTHGSAVTEELKENGS